MRPNEEERRAGGVADGGRADAGHPLGYDHAPGTPTISTMGRAGTIAVPLGDEGEYCGISSIAARSASRSADEEEEEEEEEDEEVVDA